MVSLAMAEENFPFYRSFIGIIGLLVIAYLLSNDRKKINPRVVLGGLGLQFVIAFGVLKIEVVENLFGWVAELFSIALQVSVDASAFVFGPLANFQKMDEIFSGQGFVFAFMALPSILFFSTFLAPLLFWYTSVDCERDGVDYEQDHAIIGSESLAAAANVFVGRTEAPLLLSLILRK